jgi:putative spermidine/putrescine transport system ATP-binding protein
MSAPFLEFDGLRKVYGGVVAADRVDLSIAEGEFMTFLGPSGSGKSTTLYILAGLQDPTEGDVRLRGRSILATPPQQRGLGMVFQRYTLFPHLGVAENVAFPLKVRRVGKAEIAERVARALDLVRLRGFEDRRPAQLSGGQQQRVALARALVYAPPVLLMDEPLSALDKKLREEIQYEIRRIHQKTGVTILYVTHDQEEALRLSDRIAVFNTGRIEQVGTGRELYDNPATRFVADFIGESTFLSGRILRAGLGFADVGFADGTAAIRLRFHGTGATGEAAEVMLRPERIGLAEAAPEGVTGLTVTIEDFVFLGTGTAVRVRTRWGEAVSVRLPFGHPLCQALDRGRVYYMFWQCDAARAFVRH